MWEVHPTMASQGCILVTYSNMASIDNVSLNLTSRLKRVSLDLVLVITSLSLFMISLSEERLSNHGTY